MKLNYLCLLLANIAVTCWASEWTAAPRIGLEPTGEPPQRAGLGLM